jgi:2-haloacid dehalogenase
LVAETGVLAGKTGRGLVAAHLGDLAAARSRGLRTAYVYRLLEFGPDGDRAAADPVADLSVGSLVDLAEQRNT